jgi:tRNA 2-thiocytidine biosynthesis protein TtcA
MPAKLISDDKKNIVIRPLAYAREKLIKEYAELRAFPIIPCNLCGSQENLQRKKLKALFMEWDQHYPGRVQNIFNALCRVTPSHLLDRGLFDFGSLTVSNVNTERLRELDVELDIEVAGLG